MFCTYAYAYVGLGLASQVSSQMPQLVRVTLVAPVQLHRRTVRRASVGHIETEAPAGQLDRAGRVHRPRLLGGAVDALPDMGPHAVPGVCGQAAILDILSPASRQYRVPSYSSISMVVWAPPVTNVQSRRQFRLYPPRKLVLALSVVSYVDSQVQLFAVREFLPAATHGEAVLVGPFDVARGGPVLDIVRRGGECQRCEYGQSESREHVGVGWSWDSYGPSFIPLSCRRVDAEQHQQVSV